MDCLKCVPWEHSHRASFQYFLISNRSFANHFSTFLPSRLLTSKMTISKVLSCLTISVIYWSEVRGQLGLAHIILVGPCWLLDLLQYMIIWNDTVFLTQGSNSGLPHCRKILYGLSHQGSMIIWSDTVFPVGLATPLSNVSMYCVLRLWGLTVRHDWSDLAAA